MKTIHTTLGGEPLAVHLVETLEDSLKAVNHFDEWTQGLIGVDVETNALHFTHPDFAVTLVAFATPEQVFVVVPNPETWSFLVTMVTGARMVAHNAPFDTMALVAGFGQVPLLMADSLLAGLLETPPGDPTYSHGLKAYAARLGWHELVDAEAALHAAFRDTGTSWGTFDPTDERLWVYNALDAAASERLRRHLVMEVDIPTIRTLPSEEAVQWAWLGVTGRGILVDHDHLTKLVEAGERTEERLVEDLQSRGINNPRSHPELVEWFSRNGATFTAFTAKGSPSFSSDAIPSLTASFQPDAVRATATVLEQVNAANGQVSKLREIEAMSLWTGKVHPWINTLKARTGRMSVSDPALQNIPKGPLRDIFVADDGHLLVGGDLSQVEFRVAAALSGDERMCNAILNGEDLHDTTAKAIFGPAFTKAQRDIAKTVGFGTLYGGGAKALAEQARIPLETAQGVREAFRKAYPQLHTFINDIQEAGTVRTYGGRAIPIEGGFEFRAVNYIVQGTARDLLAEATLHLVADGYGNALWLPVHDEIILQVFHDETDEALAALSEVLRFDFMGVPIVGTPEVIGKRWGGGGAHMAETL